MLVISLPSYNNQCRISPEKYHTSELVETPYWLEHTTPASQVPADWAAANPE